jgi:hypothetical protein
MEEGMSNNPANSTLLDCLYLHLSIDLANNMPTLHFTISQESDGSLSLSDHEISELDISVKIEPIYTYYRQSHSNPDDFFVLGSYDGSDPENYLISLFDREYGPIHVFPDPSLPLHWVRQISDGGTSYFYNQKTSAWMWSPGDAFTCLSFSSSAFKDFDILENFDFR